PGRADHRRRTARGVWSMTFARRLHEPTRDAARYVQGEMRERERRRFDSHLLECEECWTEGQSARTGRAFAERGRGVAPASWREDVRGMVLMSEPSGRRRVRMRVPVVALVIVGLVASGLVVAQVIRRPRQPKPIADAVAVFRSGRPPATASAS